jgi:aldehyde dehydrogenase
MQIDEALIRNVVARVLAEVGSIPPVVRDQLRGPARRVHLRQAGDRRGQRGFERLSECGIADRKRIIDHIRRISIEQCVQLGTMEMEETKIGRLEHKIEKLKTLGEKTPGVEFLRSEVFSGDHGLAVIEHAPFGVIGAITPVTHSLPTITGNAVSMIAGGNTLVVNPHPSGKRVAAEGVRRFNEAIHRDMGIDNLICVIAEPTLETADIIFKHRDVNLDLRHRRSGGGSRGAEQRQAGRRGRTGQSARRGRRNGRPGPRRPLHHPRRRRTTTTCCASPRKRSSSWTRSST